uniref:Glycosyltransferase n=1 Tax=Crocus sativus TaxID=82528 RepID=A0A0A8K9V7_CROSA|nr:glucosyltransferase 5 [Crocus sativus]
MRDSQHVFFFGLMAQGHLIPFLDMADVMCGRGVMVTRISTPLNGTILAKALDHLRTDLGLEINIKVFKFPGLDSGVPENCETVDFIASNSRGEANMFCDFLRASCILQRPFADEQLLDETKPNGVIADLFFPWATETAGKMSVPRLAFHGSSFFAMCAPANLRCSSPRGTLPEEAESVVIAGLPHRIEVLRSQMPPADKSMGDLFGRIRESELKSYGLLVNSFFELEPDYVRHYREIIGRRAWHIGPLSLRIDTGANDSSSTLIRWLDSKSPGSVVYLCFGSMLDFNTAQLREIALGLEASGRPFVWVVKGAGNEWVPEGFLEEIKGAKGLIIKGWAPQVLILDHIGIGAFVTHCGWNSAMEGVCAGVPMVTWPMYAEQFYNEKLVTQVLKSGANVGSLQWNRAMCHGAVKREVLCKALKRVMGSEEVEDNRSRSRAKDFKEMAKRAVEEGGSSYSDYCTLMEDISSWLCN